MNTTTIEPAKNAEKVIKTLILKENYRGLRSTDGGSVCYTEAELHHMLNAHQDKR